MPRLVLKADRGRDFYVIWSTVVEAPVFIGNRAETADYIGSPEGDDPAEVRLQRADKTGTSALYPIDPPYDGAWEDSGFIVEQRGWLPRSRLGEFARLYMLDESDACYALLEPFEDEEPA